MNQMRSPQKNRNNRHKGRGGHKPSGNNLNRVYESAGPEGKVRGTAQQIIDKYLLLARDAQTSGDRVVAENFLQHAEHYIRLVNAAAPPQAEDRRFQGFGAPREDSEDGEDEDDTGGVENGRAQDGRGQDEGSPRQARGHGSRRGDGDPRDDGGYREEPQRAVAGGALETIDTDDEGEDGASGPVPTPETAEAAPAEPAAQPAMQDAAEPEAEARPKPRRRTRRPKVSDEAEAG